jgi:FdrA protein
MTVHHVELRAGAYLDSVRLMQLSAAVRAVPGVSGALVAMATPLNLELAEGMGFPAPDGATPDDLLVAVAAEDERRLAAGLERLGEELAARPGAAGADPVAVAARSVGSAVRRSGASLALVSTPGRYAFLDAMDALDAGASVLVFSDNVPVEQEVRLKEVAARRGLLVMGPDCGTAVVAGVGLGFANVVRPGPVGLVAASGTGAQQVMSLLDAAGVGVSHCLGVGGRDLSEPVGGRSTLAALDALDADPATELVILLSKPPAPPVAERVRAHAQRLRTPVVVALLGLGQPDLTGAVAQALRRLGRPEPDAWPAWLPEPAPRPRPGALRGLFAGGTLCDEAMVVASRTLGPVRSNIPLRPEWTVSAGGDPDAGHTMLDLGDDEYTVGRPHPMIDGGYRLERLAAAAADPACSVVLLDVVLGHGAEPDPAAGLAPVIARARAEGAGRGLAVVVSLVGTAGDPQGLSRQAEALRAAGACVFGSNAQAARYAAGLAGSGGAG